MAMVALPSACPLPSIGKGRLTFVARIAARQEPRPPNASPALPAEASPRGMGLLRQQLFYFFRQVLAAVVHLDHPLLVHEPHFRDGVDAILRGNLVLPALAVEVVGPGHF